MAQLVAQHPDTMTVPDSSSGIPTIKRGCMSKIGDIALQAKCGELDPHHLHKNIFRSFKN